MPITLCTKNDTKNHAKVSGKNLREINIKQRTTGKKGMLLAGKIVFYREEHTNWLSNTKWLALRRYIQATSYRLNRLYLR